MKIDFENPDDIIYELNKLIDRLNHPELCVGTTSLSTSNLIKWSRIKKRFDDLVLLLENDLKDK